MGLSGKFDCTPASMGVAIGKAFVLPAWDLEVPDSEIDVADLAAEFERLYAGIRSSRDEIRLMKKEVSDFIGDEPSSIFDAHLAILDDPVFMQEIQGIIRRQYKAAEYAVKEAIDKFANMFDLLDDEYMKDRAVDIKDVGNRLLKHLLGTPEITLPEDTKPFILIAKELSPSQLVHLNPSHVLGILMMSGGKTSHSAIMARAMGIPMVLGLKDELETAIDTGDLLILDGEEGAVWLNPDNEAVEQYSRKKQSWLQQKKALQKLAHVPTVTLDGKSMQLYANINSMKELALASENGACGVGLFRTEFLFMDREGFPDEDEQYQVYREAVQTLGHRKPIVIRTLDVGSDKQLDSMNYHEEDNPALGYRALRISLDRPDLFKTQMRAILRAGLHGQVKILFPMVSSLEEIRRAKALLEEAKSELSGAGVPFEPDIRIGIMIEIPAAVTIADILAREVDFFSIGTNDLIQYLLAVDRMNERISSLYEPYHPAVIRTLSQIAGAARKNGIEVSVCGEMAGDPYAVPLWLALGIDQLSMSVQAILEVKQKVLDICSGDCRELARDLLQAGTIVDVKKVLRRQERKTVS